MEKLKCPECKSNNVREMESAENRALCLSCYHQFSIPKKPNPANVKTKEYGDETNRYLMNALADIKKMKARIRALEELVSCKEQKTTGGVK